MNKRLLAIPAVLAAGILLSASGCESAADTANTNLSKAAENFEVPRLIVGVNTITGDVLFSVEGYCSYETTAETVEAVCLEDRETGAVSRTTMGQADNVTFISTQTGPVSVDLFQPRIIFRPENIVPNMELSNSARLQGDGNG